MSSSHVTFVALATIFACFNPYEGRAGETDQGE